MSPERAHVSDVQHRLKSDLALNADVYISNRWYLSIALKSAGRRRKVEPAARQERLEIPEFDRRIQLQGRVLVSIDVKVVPLPQIVEDAEPAANGGSPAA